MVELEFLENDLNNGVVKDLSLRDLLAFITSSDIILPFGFQEKMDVYFEESNQLAKSLTCALNIYISCTNTQNKIEKALKMWKNRVYLISFVEVLLNAVLCMMQLINLLWFLCGRISSFVCLRPWRTCIWQCWVRLHFYLIRYSENVF